MRVFDQVKQEIVDVETTRKVVIHQLDKYVVYGYVSADAEIISLHMYLNEIGWIVEDVLLDSMKEYIFYSTSRGGYASKLNLNPSQYVQERYSMRPMSGDRSVYSFTRDQGPTYEAIERFNIFDGKQQVLINEDNKLAPYMKYTFGLEFETSQGCIPEPLCFRDGLIPLRDGSISGYEYSTVVLKGNEGINLLRQQIETLKAYTTFDKECSLHVHMGGYPQNGDYIFRVYYLCKILEPELERYIPPLTFKSGQYKANGKDYCKKLRNYGRFQDLYYAVTGTRFFGSLTQAHPQDIERKRKWQILSRYQWLNVVNAVCYNVNKTLEFRFLRPTYNFQKIYLWLYIFNAILAYAEKHENLSSYVMGLTAILRDIYPENLAYELEKGLALLTVLRETQINNHDECGSQVHLESRLFNNELNI